MDAFTPRPDDHDDDRPQTQGTEIEDRRGWPERAIHCATCDTDVIERETDESEPDECDDCRRHREWAERSRGER